MNKFTPQDPDIKKKIPKIKEALSKEGVQIFFVPSNKLRDLIAKGEDPMVTGIPIEFQEIFLRGDGIRIGKKMVLDWLSGDLNEKDSFALSNGDIRILSGDSYNKLISHEDIKIKE